jgi:hypothetical protein
MLRIPPRYQISDLRRHLQLLLQWQSRLTRREVAKSVISGLGFP